MPPFQAAASWLRRLRAGAGDAGAAGKARCGQELASLVLGGAGVPVSRPRDPRGSQSRAGSAESRACAGLPTWPGARTRWLSPVGGAGLRVGAAGSACSSWSRPGPGQAGGSGDGGERIWGVAGSGGDAWRARGLRHCPGSRAGTASGTCGARGRASRYRFPRCCSHKSLNIHLHTGG